jgi:hypothetical protein
MQWGLKTCFKLLKRTQRARGSVRDRRRAWQPRRSSGSGGLAWRARRTAAGKGKAAVGQGATRGSVESRRWRWVAATASSGEGRLGQTAGRRGTAGRGQRSSGKRWHWAEAARGLALSSAGAAGVLHMAGRAAAARGQREQRRWEGGRRRRTEKQIPKNTGTPL